MKKKLMVYLSILLGMALSLRAQTVQTIGGHTIMQSSNKHYELYPTDTIEIDTTKFIIKFAPTKEAVGIQQVISNGFIQKRKTCAGKYVFFKPAGSDFLESLSFLTTVSDIISVRLNHFYIGEAYTNNILIPDDNHQYDYWELKKTNIVYDASKPDDPYAWQLTVGHPSVLVAVIDDGLQWDDADFGPGLPGYDYVDGNANYMPASNHISHGTTMSSIISGRTGNKHGLCGIAGGDGNGLPPITLMTQRTCFKNSMSEWIYNADAVAFAIEEAVDNGARIINFAWGAYEPPIDAEEMNDAFKYAIENDVTIIAAAGNNGSIVHVAWPASRPDVICISGMDANEELTVLEHPRASNTGPETEFTMPGSSIETLQLPLYGTAKTSGTSISCAMATGVVGLMLSVNPCLTSEEIRNYLKQSCVMVGTYQYDANGHSDEFGFGMINAYEAVSLAMPHDDLTIDTGQDQTLDSDMSISGDIIVENNAILRIENCTILMYPSTRIIVKQGGKMYVSNAILKNYCKMPWQGIEVWGNKLQHQWVDANGNYYQGYVFLDNAVIENSIEALNLWNPADYNSTGGIVIAKESTFKNNRESVHALLYKNFHPVTLKEMDYQAIFTNCTFDIDNDFFFEFMEFFKHVDLNRVKGVKFYGCDFNLTPDVHGVNFFNKAIASYSSGFQVNATCLVTGQNGCTSYDPCTFTGFKDAIFANNPQNNFNTLFINRAVFNNNHIGINATSIVNPIVINSEFHIAQNNYSDETCSYGIYLNNSSAFSLEENKFYKQTGAPVADYIGIGVINSNSISQVYKNTFDGLSAGNYAYGKNWLDDPQTGLEYLCNINTNNYADFYVTGVVDDLTQGVQSYQGDLTIPAGNKFSDNATLHFYNGTAHPIGYNFCKTCPQEEPLLYNNISTHESTSTNLCNSHYGGTGNFEIVLNEQQKYDLELQFAISAANYDNVDLLLNQLKDGGSTETEINEINSATIDEMWEVRTQLLGDSPHLSQEVLKLVADKTTLFPESVIFDILAANPDELRDAELLKYLEEKENPLPEYMLNILRQVSLGSTYKTILQQEKTRYNYEKVRVAEDIIHSLLNEPQLDLTQIRNWLDNIGGIESDKRIIATYIQENDYVNALTLANMIPTLYDLQGVDLIEQNMYIQMLELLNTLSSENRTWEELSDQEIFSIEEISLTSEGSAGALSQSILEAYFDRHFDRCKTLQGEASYKSHGITSLMLSDAYGFKVSVQPNPATDWISFDYTLPLNENSSELIISSTLGKLIDKITLNGKIGQKVLNLSNIPAGSYTYTIKSSSFVKSGKFVVIK